MSELQLILSIIQAALSGITIIPGEGIPAEISAAFVGILQKALLLYQARTGQPLDLTQIPLETPVVVPSVTPLTA
jgi:hypothetical protein